MVYSKNYFDNAHEDYEYINSTVAKYVNVIIKKGFIYVMLGLIKYF